VSALIRCVRRARSPGVRRGVVEDGLDVLRPWRGSGPSFQSIGALVDGSALLATVPSIVAREIVALRPHLRTKALPFTFAGSQTEQAPSSPPARCRERAPRSSFSAWSPSLHGNRCAVPFALIRRARFASTDPL